MKSTVQILLLVLFFGCSDSIDSIDRYAECNSSLPRCDVTGEYCLFGYKWGEGNDFSNTGINVTGPQMAGGLVSYSFQESPTTVSNHRQRNVPTLSVEELPSCAKEKIRAAFTAWSNVANIQFEELPDDSDSDIKIFVAPVTTCGNGFPNYTSSPCNEIAGQLTLSPNVTENCDVFYSYVLHEIGDTLGLGHSARNNIMGSIQGNDGLQEGDIKGIREIYGE